MDALDELEKMHQSARQTFDRIRTAAPDERAGLWAKLRSELQLHEQIEEQFVYDPVVEDIGNVQGVSQFHERHESEADHANQVMSQIGELEPTSSEWMAKVEDLSSTMERHMEMEENEFWPLIRQHWGEDRLQDAGTSVGAAKAAGTAGASAAKAFGGAQQAVKDAFSDR